MKKAKDDGAGETRCLTDLAIEKDTKTADRRKVDKAIIDSLKSQSTTDANIFLELTKESEPSPKRTRLSHILATLAFKVLVEHENIAILAPQQLLNHNFHNESFSCKLLDLLK